MVETIIIVMLMVWFLSQLITICLMLIDDYLTVIIQHGRLLLPPRVYLHSKGKTQICTHAWGAHYVLKGYDSFEILLQIPVLSSNTKKGEIERAYC